VIALLVPCMGGFCGRRDSCAHFHADSWGMQPAERLCARGLERPMPVRRAMRTEDQQQPAQALPAGEPL
jgi:hypothetical protein